MQSVVGSLFVVIFCLVFGPCFVISVLSLFSSFAIILLSKSQTESWILNINFVLVATWLFCVTHEAVMNLCLSRGCY